MRFTLFILLLAAALPANQARAEDEDKWPDTEKVCNQQGKCSDQPSVSAAKKALSDFKKNLASMPDRQLGLIVAASARTGLSTFSYGYGQYSSYRAYQSELKTAAQMVANEGMEIRRVTYSIVKALEPELEKYGKEILKNSPERFTGAAEELGTTEARLAVEALKDPAAKARILKSLEKSLGKMAPEIYEKLVGPFSWSKLKPEFAAALKEMKLNQQLSKMSASFAAAIEKGLGTKLATSLARQTGVEFGRVSLRTVFTALKPTTTALERCLGALKVAGPTFTSAMAAFDRLNIALAYTYPNQLADGTMTGMYAQYPERLVDLSPEEANRILERHPEIRAALLQLRDLDSEVFKQENADPTGTSMSDASLQCDPAQSMPTGQTFSNQNIAACPEKLN